MGLRVLRWHGRNANPFQMTLKRIGSGGVSEAACRNKMLCGRRTLYSRRFVFSNITGKIGTRISLSHKAYGTKLPRRNSEPRSNLHFSSVHHSGPTLKSSRWKSAACARIPAASPHHTKARRSCFPYGARPWSCKIINPMAARAGCDSLPGPKKQRVTTYLSVTREVLSQAYLNRRESCRALQKRTPPNLPSLLGPYMSDEPYGATRLSNQSEG